MLGRADVVALIAFELGLGLLAAVANLIEERVVHRFHDDCDGLVRRRGGPDADSQRRRHSKKYAYAHCIQIGRASCRDRVCQYVEISVVAVSSTKQPKTTNNKKPQINST